MEQKLQTRLKFADGRTYKQADIQTDGLTGGRTDIKEYARDLEFDLGTFL